MQEQPVKIERIYDGRLFNLDRVTVILPDGREQPREVVRHPGAVALIALDERGDILMVRQYRIAAERVMLEIPAGTLDPAEPPEVCAVRELQEETGFKPGTLQSLHGFFVAPGYTTEYIHLFLATDLSESRLPGDDDEFIEVAHVPLADLLAMIERGDISDGKSIIGLLRYARMVKA